MDAATRGAIETLDTWCRKGRAALRNRGIPPNVPEFKFHMLGVLAGVQLVQGDARLTELLVCLDYWCRQPDAFSRLWPRADPCSAKAAKFWFLQRTAIILGIVKL